MVSGKRRAIYVATAIIGALVVILAVLLLQQPIQPKTTPPPTSTAPAVSTVGASGVGQTTATLNGNLASLGSAANVNVGFYYGTDATGSGATNTSVDKVTAAAPFGQAVSGLTAGTTYYFRAWALGDGFSAGSLLSFSTLAGPSPQQHQPPAVATNAASNVRNASAELNGNLSSLGTATSVTIGFRYGTSPTLAGATNVTVGTESSTGEFTTSAVGLTANTTYYVQAWGSGDGFATGTIVSFKTAPTSSGNGHRVPPGWRNAACPDLPEGAPAHGVRMRCMYNETYGQWKKDHPSDALETTAPDPSTVERGAARTSDPGNSGSHRSGNNSVG